MEALLVALDRVHLRRSVAVMVSVHHLMLLVLLLLVVIVARMAMVTTAAADTATRAAGPAADAAADAAASQRRRVAVVVVRTGRMWRRQFRIRMIVRVHCYGGGQFGDCCVGCVPHGCGPHSR